MKNFVRISVFLLCGISTIYAWQPRVSVITSVYKGDDFIAGYLKDIERQTIFSECEFIIVNANSPGNEEAMIAQYAEKYPNIIYVRLVKDPGLYAVWNFAISKARAPYITNWNIDDRRSIDALEAQASALDTHTDIDAVYADIYLSAVANQVFEQRSEKHRCVVPEFSVQGMRNCFTGPAPMWRIKIHETTGLFNEWFTSAGDWEFFLRAVGNKHKLMKINHPNCLYYYNPKGISTTEDPVKAAVRNKEVELILRCYHHIWA